MKSNPEGSHRASVYDVELLQSSMITHMQSQGGAMLTLGYHI
jgi:hypothetical protein